MQAICIGGYKNKKEMYGIAGLLLLFFGILFIFGPGHYPDTQGYIEMNMAREPLYPIFLWLCRVIAGTYSLWLAILLQNLFCGYMVYRLYFYVKKMCEPGVFLRIGLLGSLLLPHLVTPLFSASHMILSNCIISEGLCYPLYQLFGYLLLGVLWEDEKKIFPAFLVAFLLELTRGQMMIAVPLWMLVSGYRVWCEAKKRRLFLVAALGILLFVLRGPFICTYNWIVHDTYAQNTSNYLTILTNLLYASERENGEQIEDETLKGLWYEMYDGMEERGYSYHFAGDRMQERAIHQEYTHDYIKFDVVTPVLKNYARSLPAVQRGEMSEEVCVDQIASAYTGVLLKQNLPVRLQVYLAVAWCGLIRTATFLHPGINLLTMLVYLVLLVLAGIQLRKKPTDRGAQFLLFSYVMICANVFATALMIMCLSRYVIYNTSFLYIAALLVLGEFVQTWNIRERKE